MFSKLIEKIHLIHYHPTHITQMPIFYEKIIKHFNSITIFYEKICFYAKQKANLKSQKKEPPRLLILFLGTIVALEFYG